MFKLTLSDAYYAAYSRYIGEILKRPLSRLRVAVLTDDEDVVLGWSVDEKDILHYVFVKKDFRNHGIGESLIPPGIKTFSNITHIGLAIWQTKYPSLKFNPFV
jgi:GNAT superfamily N-acetyltransferase